MAAPILVDSDTDLQASGADNDLDFVLAGGTPADGDVLIAVLIGTTENRRFTVPSGWTEKYNSFDNNTQDQPLTQIMYRVAASEPSGNYTFPFGAYGTGRGALMRWSGMADPAVDSGTVQVNFDQADDAAIISPLTTPTNADSIVLRIIVDGSLSSGADTINGPPASHTRVTGTPVSGIGGAGYSLLCVDYRTQGASSSGTETYDAAPDYHANYNACTWFIGPSGGGGGGGGQPSAKRFGGVQHSHGGPSYWSPVKRW